MKITRNGIEIDLTTEEIRLAYEEYTLGRRIEDIKSVIAQNPDSSEVGEEQLRLLADKVSNALANIDCFSEIYWETIDIVLEEEFSLEE